MESKIPKTLILTQPKVAHMPFRVVRIKGWASFNGVEFDLQKTPEPDDTIQPMEIVVTLRRMRDGSERLTSAVISHEFLSGPVQAIYT
jgi:hypothetical protein